MALVHLFQRDFLRGATQLDKNNSLTFLKDNKAIYVIADNSSEIIISDDVKAALLNSLSVYDEEKVFITLFTNKEDFANHSDKISWGSYVWIATEPHHTIHFDSKPTIKPRSH
jgi:hypothetical protein